MPTYTDPDFRASAWLCYMLARDGRHLPMAMGATWDNAGRVAVRQFAGVDAPMRRRMVAQLRYAPLDADDASEVAEWFAADPAAAVWCQWDGEHVGPSYGPGRRWVGG